MYFYMPTKVYQEQDCVRHHAGELAAVGTKALIVTGKSSAKKNGSLDDVIAALEQHGTAYEVYDRIEENPSIETVMDARAFGLSAGADYVIGIGGGSPLDAAKAIALMMKNPSKEADFLYEKTQADALPVALVPTTCGTGSEVTPYAILTIHNKRTKSSLPHRIYPALALIDGKYLVSAPAHVLANTAVDALGHMIESYCNANATDYSRMCASSAMEVWARCKHVLTDRASAKDEDYGALMEAAALAGMAITHTGTSLPHALSYKITYESGVPHGKAVGTFLAAYLSRADKKDQEVILQKTGLQDIDTVKQFIRQAVGEVKVTKAFLKEGVEALMSNQAKLKNCPYPVDEAMVTAMYEESCIVEE